MLFLISTTKAGSAMTAMTGKSCSLKQEGKVRARALKSVNGPILSQSRKGARSKVRSMLNQVILLQDLALKEHFVAHHRGGAVSLHAAFLEQ